MTHAKHGLIAKPKNLNQRSLLSNLILTHMQTSNDKGVKAPQSAAQRKAKQRKLLKSKCLKMVIFPEIWATAEQCEKIKFRCAQVIANVLSENGG